MNIVHKARALQTKIKVYLEIRKQIKTQRYRRFLQNPSRPLPGYHKLRVWRNTFLLSAVLCLAVPSIQVVFFYNTIWEQPEPLKPNQDITLGQVLMSFYNTIPVIFGGVFMILGFFGMIMDWCIYRRWGYGKSIIKWG